MNIREELFALSDPEYRVFQANLTPTVTIEQIIGVRIPVLRDFAKKIYGTPEAEAFLQELPHKYYDENNLHAFLVEKEKMFDNCTKKVDNFLPFVDNWATCDMMRPKVFGKHLPELLPFIKRWLASDETYTIRYGIEMLMNFYLDGAFAPEYPEWVAAIKSEEYYVNMMIAWYFATALAKQYDAVLPYLQDNKMSVWVHNKTIQKAVESRRITPEQKEYLKSLRRKR